MVIINKTVLIGRLTADPELNFTSGKGTAVCKFTLAVDDGFGDNKKTYFIPIVIWGKSAEATANYTGKGSKVAVNGKIQTRSYDANDGTKRYVTEVVADMIGGIEFLDNKKNNSSENSCSGGYQQADPFGGMSFDDDMTPVDDGFIPF